MAHMKYVSRPLPNRALQLPADHTIEFFLANLPKSVLELIGLICHHIKAITEPGT